MPAQNLKTRTFQYAASVAHLVETLPYSIVNRHYFAQIIRSSSSVGANFRASQRAKSDADFLNKLKIVEEEADETIFFLELLLELNTQSKSHIEPIIREGTEILKIIVASLNTVREKIKKTAGNKKL